MSDALLAFAVCAALALTACSIGKPIPQPNTYVVQAPAPQSVPSVTPGLESLRIGNVRVAAAYAGTALVYRTDDVRLVSDPYSRFIAEPGAMLGDQRPSGSVVPGFSRRSSIPKAHAQRTTCSRRPSRSCTAISARAGRPPRCWRCSSRSSIRAAHARGQCSSARLPGAWIFREPHPMLWCAVTETRSRRSSAS